MAQRDVVGTENLINRRNQIAERLASIEKEGQNLRVEDAVLSGLLKKSERIEINENGKKSYKFGATEAIIEYVRDHPLVSRSELLSSLEHEFISNSDNRRQVLSSTLTSMMGNTIIADRSGALSLADDT